MRPPKGTLPALQPRWVLMEYVEGTLSVQRTFVQKPTDRKYHRPMGQWVAVHSLQGIVSTYETDAEGKIHPCKIESRVLLFNQGGVDARFHWQIVNSVGPLRGYYLLVDARENRVLSTVEVTTHGNL